MQTEQITIRVDPRVASAYRGASEEERRKLDLLLSLRLADATRSGASLREIIMKVSRNAQARGLTPEVLAEILDAK